MKTIHACVIGFMLLFHASAEVTLEGAKNTEERTPNVTKVADTDRFFPEDVAIDDTYYRAAMLQSMLHKREEKGNIRFRLAIMPSFSKPLFLTYSRGIHGASIEIIRLQMRRDDDGMRADGIELSGKMALGDRISELLEEDAMTPSIRLPMSHLTKEQRQMTQGLDGTTYVIEVSTDTNYTVESVWTPEAIITEEAIIKALKEQQVDTEALTVDLKRFVAFRDHLLDIVGLK